MINATFRPIDRWPAPDGLTPSHKRKRSPFHRATWESTLELLDHELKMHGAKAVVISLALTDREIRRDGWPRRDARPAHPGVILQYDDPAEGWTTFHADQFDDWQHNVRAVARTIAALRQIERDGAAHGLQYVGFRRELPGAAGGTVSTNGRPSSRSTARARGGSATRDDDDVVMSREEAARFLAEHSEIPVDSGEAAPSQRAVEVAYRYAARKLHPDHGGDHDLFAKLQEAREILIPPERT